MTMALTATAQSALPGLSWDEQIVPALRKRMFSFENVMVISSYHSLLGLESESRALSKRMSTVSIGSADESSAGYVKNSATRPSTSRTDTANGRVTPASTSTSATTDRPSAIPRPSLNYSRPLIDRSNNYAARPMPANVSVEKPQPKRSRTYSQPYPYDPSLSTRENGSNSQSSSTKMTNALPTPASSRSNSPAIPMIKPLDVKPTRIPKVASNQKMALSSSTNGSAKSESRNTPPQTSDKRFLGPEYTTDNWQVYENSQYASSQSSVSVPRQTRQNGIMYEMPPFTANSYTSSIVTDAEPTARLSAEEERPFEHWYRGDLSRNGGVGELRIGNRMEMLEIANYGHKLRQLPNGSMAAGRRRRAESIGNRESVILDEYDPRGTMVLDETPLTDMEVDTELETDREMSFTSSMRRPREPERTNTNASNHSEDTTITATPTMLTIAAPRQRMDSQIPRATQIPKQPAYTYRSASEPPETLAASTSTNGSAQSRLPAAMSQSMSSAQQKRSRTKSPAAAPANKKPKGAIGQKRSKSAIDVRLRSGGTEYPDVPDEPGMADAIPSWTQPKRNGNWDEVRCMPSLVITLLTIAF